MGSVIYLLFCLFPFYQEKFCYHQYQKCRYRQQKNCQCREIFILTNYAWLPLTDNICQWMMGKSQVRCYYQYAQRYTSKYDIYTGLFFLIARSHTRNYLWLTELPFLFPGWYIQIAIQRNATTMYTFLDNLRPFFSSSNVAANADTITIARIINPFFSFPSFGQNSFLFIPFF